MRAAVDATPLLGLRTGIGVFCQELLAGLARRDDVDVIAFAVSGRGGHRLDEAVPPGVRVARARPLPAAIAHRLWAQSRLLGAHHVAGPHDVIHGTNFVVPPSSTSMVVTVHDLTAVRFPAAASPGAQRFPDLVAAAIRRGAWVHTLSEHVAHEIVDHFGAPAERVVPIHLGLGPLPPGDAGQGRAMAGVDRYVLAVGTVEPRKGVVTLVDALAHLDADLDDVGLVIAGPDGWGADEVDRAVGASPHRDRVRRLGYVSAEQRSHLLAGAAALAFPSIYEGFGFPPLEAMSAGTPVVASEAGAIPEVVGDAALLVPPGDVAALGHGLRQVLTDSGLAGRLVEAGRVRAAGFTWERCVDQMVELYRAATA